MQKRRRAMHSGVRYFRERAYSPGALGHNDEERAQTLVGVLDGYFNQGSHALPSDHRMGWNNIHQIRGNGRCGQYRTV